MRPVLALCFASALTMAQSLPLDRTISLESPALMLTFANTGRSLTALCRDGKIRKWDAGSGSPAQDQSHTRFTFPAAFITRHEQVVSVAPEGSVQLWNANAT